MVGLNLQTKRKGASGASINETVAFRSNAGESSWIHAVVQNAGNREDRSDGSGFEKDNSETPVLERSAKHKPTPARPGKYRIILLNDDFTPMELVVHILQQFFSKTLDEGMAIMLAVHHHGAGVCGVYPRDVAETKITQVTAFARQNGSPLRCRLERASS